MREREELCDYGVAIIVDTALGYMKNHVFAEDIVDRRP